MKLTQLLFKDQPNHTKPREKMSREGSDTLKLEELLALILGSGSKQIDVLQLADQILTQFPLQTWSTLSKNDLETISGIGPARAAQLAAVAELINRYGVLKASKSKILSSNDAVIHLQAIAGQDREYLQALYLNARGELLDQQTLSIGSLNQVVISPRDVFSTAVKLPCTQVILAHNHPSGDPEPSLEDIQFTRIIIAAGELLGIELLDHLIVTANGHYSLREEGHFADTFARHKALT